MDDTFYAGGLYWHRYGEAGAPPMVVFHGLFGSADNWRSQADALGEDRIVLVCDMPNHGRSDHTDTFEYGALAPVLWSAIDEALEYVGTPGARVVLHGHSMGGKAAMACALVHPDRCDRLIVADIAPKEYPPRHDEIFDAMEAVRDADVASRGEAERVMSRFIPEKPVRLFLLKSLIATGDRYEWTLNLDGLRECYETIRGWPFPRGAATYDGETLFLRGGNSPYLSDSDADRINGFFPAARVHTIGNAGHWLHAEARDEYVSVVRDFVL
jgi:pimeloyl-ACP methyl ester carboxylesterase